MRSENQLKPTRYIDALPELIQNVRRRRRPRRLVPVVLLPAAALPAKAIPNSLRAGEVPSDPRAALGTTATTASIPPSSLSGGSR